MNFAFQALLFFALILPGLLLRNTYNGKIAKDVVLPQNYPTFSREAVRVFMCAATLNAAWICLASYAGKYFDFSIDLDSALFLLMGNYDDAMMSQKAINAVVQYPVKVFAYFITLADRHGERSEGD